MKSFLRFLFLIVLACSAPAAVSSAALQSAASPHVEVIIDKVSLADMTQEHLQLSLLLTLLSDTDVAVKEVTFDNIRVNDAPLYVAPVNAKLSLKANQKQQLPEPLKLALYFRDLDSIRPLQTVISEKRIRFEGTAYLDGELPTFAKILLLGKRVRVPVTFRADVPVNVPDNPALQSIAPKVLSAAGVSLGALSSLAETLLRRTSPWRDQVWRDFAPSLLLGYVRFTLRNKKGERENFEYTGAGYRISANQFILCKSLVEPWKFDPDVASALKFGGLKLDPAGYDIWVWPLNARVRDAGNELMASTAFRLAPGDFRRVAQPGDENTAFYALQPEGRPKKIDLHKRDSASNLVLFEFRNPPPFPGPVKRNLGDSRMWDRVAVFRFPGGVSGREARADLVLMPANRTGSMITLETPVDSSAWGSPVVSADGVIGVVQDHTSAVPLKDALETLKLK